MVQLSTKNISTLVQLFQKTAPQTNQPTPQINQPTPQTCSCKNGSSAFSRKIAELATNNQDNGIDNISDLFEDYKNKNAIANKFLENMPTFDAVSLEYIIGRLSKERLLLVSKENASPNH